jgi:hypothetical protein
VTAAAPRAWLAFAESPELTAGISADAPEVVCAARALTGFGVAGLPVTGPRRPVRAAADRAMQSNAKIDVQILLRMAELL